jgi:Zn-dependent protease
MAKWPAMSASVESPARPPASRSFGGYVALWLWLVIGAGLAVGFASGPLTFAFIMLGWVLSVTVHEFGHAWVAYQAGDKTVLAKGYLSLDPRRYGDLRTSLLIPLIALALGGIGFPGGAVNLRTDLMRGRMWRSAVALAGPGATLVVLLVLAAVLYLARDLLSAPLGDALAFLALLQAMALVLNLLPIPGLDGFGALRPFLPQGWNKAVRQVERFALIGLLLILFGAPGASEALWQAAGSLVRSFGVHGEAVARGYRAFHFWT